MADRPALPSRRVLDPMERTEEILFGVIMAISFTGTIAVATAGRDDVTPVLYAAIGCNIAWGIVDAVMYVIGSLVEQSRRLAAQRAFAEANSAAELRQALHEHLPERAIEFLATQDLSAARAEVRQAVRGARVRITGEDLRGAIGIFFLVVLATFPVVLPYFLVQDPVLARRVANGISIVMLYACGHKIGQFAGAQPVRVGLAMVAIGVALVATTIALGG